MIEEKESRDLVLRDSQAAEARERYMKQEDMISQLCNIDHANKHRRMQKVRHLGTGSWFTLLAEYKSWRAATSSAVLCCYGIPGCGKSVLISSLIDSIAAEVVPGSNTKMVFYYCDYF